MNFISRWIAITVKTAYICATFKPIVFLNLITFPLSGKQCLWSRATQNINKKTHSDDLHLHRETFYIYSSSCVKNITESFNIKYI